MPESRRAGRLAALRQLLAEARYTSQAALAEALAAEGITVGQSTLSKDLLELGAIRQRAQDGSLVYAAPARDTERVVLEKLARICSEVLVSIRHANAQIVVKTPPGAAQYLASHLDQAQLEGVLGTIAGDDTVLIICTDSACAAGVAGGISEMTKTGQPSEGPR